MRGLVMRKVEWVDGLFCDVFLTLTFAADMDDVMIFGIQIRPIRQMNGRIDR